MSLRLIFCRRTKVFCGMNRTMKTSATFLGNSLLLTAHLKTMQLFENYAVCRAGSDLNNIFK